MTPEQRAEQKAHEIACKVKEYIPLDILFVLEQDFSKSLLEARKEGYDEGYDDCKYHAYNHGS